MASNAVVVPSEDPATLSKRGRSVILNALAAAPALYGRRAWRLRMAHDALELHADTRQWLPATETGRRPLRTSCGPALFNLRLAVTVLGRRPMTAILPDPSRDDLIAVVRMAGFAAQPPEWRRLHAVLMNRGPLRGPADHAQAPTVVRHALRRAVELEGSWLTMIGGDQRTDRLYELLEQARRSAELSGQLEATGLTAFDPWEQWPPQRPGEHERESKTAPMYAVIGSFHDLPVGQVRLGQALQRASLTAATYGFCTSLLPGVLNGTEFRTELVRQLGRHLYPQIVLRVRPCSLAPLCRDGFGGQPAHRWPAHPSGAPGTRY